jgi:uncharacterized protein
LVCLVTHNETILGSAVVEFMTRNWALLGIATTLVLLIVIPAIVIRKYVRISLNILDDLSPPVWPESRDHVRDRGDDTTFSAFDGHLLCGTMLSACADVARKGVIIFAHEFGVDRWSQHRYGGPLRKAGYDVFTFDFRGHGESPHEPSYRPRQFPTDREMADMTGAIAYVEHYLEKRGLPKEVGLFGISRGGGTAILSAVNTPCIKAIAVDGAYSSDIVVEYHLKRWACIFAKLRIAYENHPPLVWRLLRWLIMSSAARKFQCRFPSVRKALRRIRNVPMLFIHGERDSYIPPEQGHILYETASEPKFIWEVRGARHNQCVNQQPEEYARRTVAFFDRYLAGCETVDDRRAMDMLTDVTQPLDHDTRSGADTDMARQTAN